MRFLVVLCAVAAVSLGSLSLAGAQGEGQKRVVFSIGVGGDPEGVLVIETDGSRRVLEPAVDLAAATTPWPEGGRLWVVAPEAVEVFLGGNGSPEELTEGILSRRLVDEASTLVEIRHRYAYRGGAGLVLAGQRFTYDDGFFEDVGPGDAPSRAPSIWATAMPWVSLAVLGNALLAFGVLFGRRRNQGAQ